MKKVNIACVSAGKHARKNIIPSLISSPYFKIVKLHARNLSGLDVFAIDMTDNEEIIYSDKSIEAVYISSPNALHGNQIRKCLENGKHVIVEKTAITSFDESEELFNIARSKGLIIFEAFMYKYHKQYKFIRELVARKQYGDLLFIEAAFGFPELPADDIRYQKKLDGGALFDAGAYSISCVQGLVDNLKLISSRLFYDKHYEVDTRGFAAFASENSSALCYWYIDGSYQNFLKITFQDGILEAKRIFSKPINHETSVIISKNGNVIEEFNFDGENHFENMFHDFFTKIFEQDLSSNHEAYGQYKTLKEISKSI
tara:strand:- start:6963 stop:7904 length:942 start_codon:yes stop_codon:yes gene_type:complete